MGDYRITRKGVMILTLISILAIAALMKGSIYLAVFSFIFSASALALIVYEVLLNK